MSQQSPQILQKLWSHYQILRNDGLSYRDFVEQLTFLLFLKMAHERTLPPRNQPSAVPQDFDWPSLLTRESDALEVHYRRLLLELGKQPGLTGVLFIRAQDRIRNPAKLRRLILDIDREQWSALDADVQGEAYEELLEKSAREGASLSFTPRPLIQTIVDVLRLRPDETLCDPACGTGGFLVAAYEAISQRYPRMDRGEKRRLKLQCLRGYEIDFTVTRLCAMNLLLHGIGPEIGDDAEPPVETRDSLMNPPGRTFDIVLTCPPFGVKSGVPSRKDFWVSTPSQHLNFVQHVRSLLEVHGRAAVVVPDSVLFEGGAGETVRRKLLQECDLHTLLRLPTGLFQAPGFKPNVLFFDRKPSSPTPWTEKLWVYDLRTNLRFPQKTNPLKRSDLEEFVEAYNPDDRHDRKPTWSAAHPAGRWRDYSYDELTQRERCNLDLFWLKDESLEASGRLPGPDVIAGEIIEDLRAALEQLEAIQAEVGAGAS